jgi:hypothetical protein
MTHTPRVYWRVVLTLFFFCLFCGIDLSAQDFSSINLDLIPQKKVRNYICDKQINTFQNFHSIHASWKPGIDVSSFREHEKVFYVNDNIADVWNCYSAASPLKSWNGHFVRFAMLISKQSNSVMYSNNLNFSEIDTGQVYFLDLRLLDGLFNVPVAFEIIKVDSINKVFEFSYIDGNKSQGKQVVQFFDNGDGTTRIVHHSYFKSGSNLRDDIYPYFHTKIISEFHKNMLQMINQMLENRLGTDKKEAAHSVTGNLNYN